MDERRHEGEDDDRNPFARDEHDRVMSSGDEHAMRLARERRAIASALAAERRAIVSAFVAVDSASAPALAEEPEPFPRAILDGREAGEVAQWSIEEQIGNTVVTITLHLDPKMLRSLQSGIFAVELTSNEEHARRARRAAQNALAIKLDDE